MERPHGSVPPCHLQAGVGGDRSLASVKKTRSDSAPSGPEPFYTAESDDADMNLRMLP